MMKKYDSYKDSGVEWIGELPSHWEVKKLKNVSHVKPSNVDKHIFPDEIQVRLCNYTDVYYNDFITCLTELKRGSCNSLEFEKFRLEKGDVIITKDSESPDDIGIPCLVVDDFDDVVCGYHLTLIRPQCLMGGYIFRFIQSDRTRRYFEVHSNGITRYGLGKSSIENLSLPFPPLSEQHQIVSFLDTKTSLIDSLIEKTQRKIELLKEKRTALINEVVTKGLNPNVEMKDSGVEWIGEIPSHWEETRLRFVGGLFGGLTGKSGDDFKQDDNPNNKPYIPYTNIFRNTYISKEHFDYVVIESGENQNKVQKYDLFFLMSSETYQDLGKPCILIEDVEELYLNSFCKGFRVKRGDVNPLFLNYQLLGNVHRELVSIEGRGFTRINLRQDRLNDTPILLPPLPEQEQIVSYLDEHTQLIDKTISLEERRIELLKEYRQSLISEVVTGKRKVVTHE